MSSNSSYKESRTVDELSWLWVQHKLHRKWQFLLARLSQGQHISNLCWRDDRVHVPYNTKISSGYWILTRYMSLILPCLGDLGWPNTPTPVPLISVAFLTSRLWPQLRKMKLLYMNFSQFGYGYVIEPKTNMCSDILYYVIHEFQ